MYLSSVKFSNFRNLKNGRISLDPTLNIFEGENAAGKSSILEGVGFLLAGRSFRTIKTNQLVNKDSPSFTLYGEVSNGTNVGISFDRGKNVKSLSVNGNRKSSLSDLASIYPVQMLTPESYHLIDSGPNQRRKFFDWLLFHVEHNYRFVWQSLNRVLKQRNSYLRSLKGDVANLDQSIINIWNSKLVEVSSQIDEARKDVLARIKNKLTPILNSMSLSFVESLTLEYKQGFSGHSLLERLDSTLSKDIINRTTSNGAHKADIVIKNFGVEVKESLSRGQKKMLINALFLSQTGLLKECAGKESLFVIDDFSSELDQNNQLQLVRALHQHKDVQVMLTCLDSRVLKPLIKEYNSVNMFHVKHGEINKVVI